MVQNKLQGKKAIITGGDSGIGAAVAIDFAKQGADVAIVFHKDVEGAEKVKKEVEKLGRACVCIQADVSQESEVLRIYKEAQAVLGPKLDILVNNAGMGAPTESWEDFSVDTYKRVLRVNLTGYFLMAKHALKQQLMSAGGRIIMTGSVQGQMGSKKQPAYAATKGGIHAMCKSLAKYVMDRGITVNCVAPGPVDTPLMRADSPHQLQRDKESKRMFPLGVAEPDVIAQTFTFLASREGDHYSGVVLSPVSGMIMAD